MSLESILVGAFAILIGAAWAFYGLKVFVILLPIWGFFIGLLAGAQLGQEILGEGFLGTVTSWVIGVVFGIILAVFSYFWYFGAIILLGASVGYTLGAGLLGAIGLDGFLAVIAGLIVAVLVAIAVVVLAVPAWLVILLSALGGAAAVVNGALILLGRIQLNDIEQGLTQGLLKEGAIGVIAFVVIAVAGFFYQARGVAQLAETAVIDRERYQVS